mgnify:CR=1 FL=1
MTSRVKEARSCNRHESSLCSARDGIQRLSGRPTSDPIPSASAGSWSWSCLPSRPEPKESTEPDSPYPSVLVSTPRTVLVPEGATKEAQIIDLTERIALDSEAHLPTLRDTMVFSVGSLNAELMFIGEAPGSEEERQQEPFVGPAGQLLTKIIQAMGLFIFLTSSNTARRCPTKARAIASPPQKRCKPASLTSWRRSRL